MYGVCFEEANHYADGGGPMVRWFGGGVCNVYSDFCVPVERIRGESPRVEDLLEANNRYLEEGRDARRRLERTERLLQLLLDDLSVAVLYTRQNGRRLLVARLTTDGDDRRPEAFCVYQDATKVFEHGDLEVAFSVYQDHCENQ